MLDRAEVAEIREAIRQLPPIPGMRIIKIHPDTLSLLKRRLKAKGMVLAEIGKQMHLSGIEVRFAEDIAVDLVVIENEVADDLNRVVVQLRKKEG